MRLATTELQFIEGPYLQTRIGHEAGCSWSAIAESVMDIFGCEESDVDLLQADEDEAREHDQVTVCGKPVANIIKARPAVAEQHNQLEAAE